MWTRTQGTTLVRTSAATGTPGWFLQRKVRAGCHCSLANTCLCRRPHAHSRTWAASMSSPEKSVPKRRHPGLGRAQETLIGRLMPQGLGRLRPTMPHTWSAECRRRCFPCRKVPGLGGPCGDPAQQTRHSQPRVAGASPGGPHQQPAGSPVCSPSTSYSGNTGLGQGGRIANINSSMKIFSQSLIINTALVM